MVQPERKGSIPVMRSVWHRASLQGQWEKIAEFELIATALDVPAAPEVIGLVATSHRPLISPVSMAGKMSVCASPRAGGKKLSSMPQNSATALRSFSFSRAR